jgi:hypothetical protein
MGSYIVENSSIIALNAGDLFSGSYVSNLNFAEIKVSVNCDSTFELKIFYSSDSVNDDLIDTYEQLTISSNVLYNLQPKMRYFKIQLTNTGLNQSYLRLQTLLKSIVTYTNIDLSGQSIAISNLPASVPVTNADITNIYNVVNTRGISILWSGSATGAGGVSLAVDLSNKNVKNITFIGNCNGATLLTVQFSSDGTTYYDSQYAFTLSAAGDVGFSLACCPNFIRVKSSNNVTASLYINYC